MESREVFVSPRPGELRSQEVLAVTGADVEWVDVVVLATGSRPITATLPMGRRWAGAGWQRMLACPRCHAPVGVLYERRGELLCRRCGPRLTVGQSEHQKASWTKFDGAIEAKLLRTALRGLADHGTRATAAELLARDTARVDAALADAREYIEACDAVLVAGGVG